MYPNRLAPCSLICSAHSGLNLTQFRLCKRLNRRKESQGYWIFPREPGWRISFHFTMTFLQSQRWSAPPLPPSSHIPTEQSPLHCCLSFFHLSTHPSHTFYSNKTEQPPHQQRDQIPIPRLSSHQMFTPIQM